MVTHSSTLGWKIPWMEVPGVGEDGGVDMRAKSLQLCPTLCDPKDCSPPGSSVYGGSPGKNTGVGCHVLLQEIFPIQELNPSLLDLLHW